MSDRRALLLSPSLRQKNLLYSRGLPFSGPGFPRTCFHSILSLLNTSLLYRKDKAVLKVHPHLVQLAYKIVHTLCANPNTSDSVLRYLRSSQDFVQQHMALFPFRTYDKVTEFVCMAWVLKIFSIELRVISSIGHMNKLEDLVKLFLYNNPGDFSKSRKGHNVRKLINGGKRCAVILVDAMPRRREFNLLGGEPLYVRRGRSNFADQYQTVSADGRDRV